MLPYYAAAGVFALGATALAWFLDRQTEEEFQWHEELIRRNGEALNALNSAKNTNTQQQAQDLESAARQLKAEYERYCKRFRARLKGPAQEFNALAKRLDSDMADGSISPYRRNALRLLKGRLQDTQNRLSAFFAYCDWYSETLTNLIERRHFKALITMAKPRSRLPDDWLYSGKVVLASVVEIDGCRNNYSQQLELRTAKFGEGYSDTQQRSLMMQYPDQDAIPVQIIGGKNPRYFKACIFRGALQVEHIMPSAPCIAHIEKYTTSPRYGDGYSVSCYPAFYAGSAQQAVNNGVRAFLPRSETSFPGKSLQRGERTEVYMHYYDLMLSGRDVTVTQHADSLRYGEQSTAPVFVHVDTTQHDLRVLEEESADSTWQLRGTMEMNGALSVLLQLGAWQIDTQVCPEGGQLQIVAITHTGINSVELDELPCPIRLIDQRLKDSVFCDVLQFDAFLGFCRQQSLFTDDDLARKRAGQFFDRWNAVTEYLLVEEGYYTFALSDLVELDERSLECRCEQDLEKTLQKLTDEDQKPRHLFVEELYSGTNAEQRWLQVAQMLGVPDAVGAKRYQIDHRGVSRPDPRGGYKQVVPPQQRVRFPKAGELANLNRQKQALQGFLNGRLVNRALQQILLMPDRYQPVPDPFWAQQVDSGLQWQNPNWQDPSKAVASKRLIEAALTESNLYLLQGPPGTGKTTCIVELLYQLLTAKPDSRVLVVSQQNTAVDNALDRFLQQFPAFSDKVLRLGNNPNRVEASVRPHLTESVLMDYLQQRQQEYSRATLENLAKAEWLHQWMDSIYRPARNGIPRFDDELAELVVQDHGLVGATCVGLSSRRYGMDKLSFDVCIVDEAGRATVPELLIPLMRSRKAIIIGDHFQLPPSVASRLLDDDAKDALPFLEETFLKTSFFEQLYDNLPEANRGRLTEQFRMVEPIGDLVADLFYTFDGSRGLYNGKTHQRKNFLDPEHCLRWVDVPHGKQENEAGNGPSLINRAEAREIQNYLKVAGELLTRRRESSPKTFVPKTVAVITPYGAQKRFITKQIDVLKKKVPALDSVLDIKVDTVDGFQGSEADIVLYSTVRTGGQIRFLLDRQRLNVACSRARENIVFFGHAQFLRMRERNEARLFTRIIDRCTQVTATAPSRASRGLDLSKAAVPAR